MRALQVRMTLGWSWWGGHQTHLCVTMLFNSELTLMGRVTYHVWQTSTGPVNDKKEMAADLWYDHDADLGKIPQFRFSVIMSLSIRSNRPGWWISYSCQAWLDIDWLS